MNDEEDQGGVLETRTTVDEEEVQKLRKELTATRIAAYGQLSWPSCSSSSSSAVAGVSATPR